MKRKKYVLIFTFIWIAFLCFFYLPEKTFSSFENRYLKTFELPTISTFLDQSWMDDLEHALTDQFRFRNASISTKTYTDKFLGQKDNGRVYFGKDGYLFEMEKEMTKQLDINLDCLNHLANQTEIPMDFMPVYHSLAILEDKRPSFTSSHQQNLMTYMQSNLDEKIKVIDLYDTLKNSNEQIYYRTDHHWTTYGAYLAYQQYLGKLAINRNLISVSSNFLGTLYHQAPTLNVSKDEILSLEEADVQLTYPGNVIKDSYYSKNMLKRIDQYRYFLDGNYERIDIKTKVKNDEKLLVIKDSFANCFIPFLNEHYASMTVIDPRYGNLDINEILKEGYTRILVLYEMDNFAADKDISRVIKND